MRRRTGIIGVSAIVVALTATSAAATPPEEPAPPPPELSPGVYAGSNAIFAQGLFVDLGTGTVTANVSYEGTFDLIIADDLTSTGRFVLGGAWDLEVTTDEGIGTAIGSTGASGGITGEGTTLTYDGTETNVFQVEFRGITQEFSNAGSIPAVSFTITAASCSEIAGEWERAWEGVADAAGYENPEILAGDFWAIRTSDEEERARIEQFFADNAAAADASEQAAINTEGLPPIYREMTALAAKIVQLSTSTTWDSGPDWIALIDEAAELSERVRNADPCVFGGRELERSDFTYPTTVVIEALRALLRWVESDDIYFDNASMRALASRAMQHNVVGPRAYSPELSGEVQELFQGWVDAAAADSENDPDGAVDALVVGSALGVSVSEVGVGGGE